MSPNGTMLMLSHNGRRDQLARLRSLWQLKFRSGRSPIQKLVTTDMCLHKEYMRVLSGHFSSDWYGNHHTTYWLDIAWTPLPSLWSGMYAFTHVSVSADVRPSLKLVDAKKDDG